MDQTGNSKRTVLVAEDEEDIRMMLKIFLQEHHCRVVEAINGQHAIEVAQQEHPNLILMDLNMPMLDGAAALRLIRQNKDLRDVPAIIITAHGELGIKFYLDINKFGGGRIEYLPKPIELDELKSLLTQCLAEDNFGQ